MKKHHLPIDQHNYHNSRKLGGRPAVAQELAVAVLREQQVYCFDRKKTNADSSAWSHRSPLLYFLVAIRADTRDK